MENKQSQIKINLSSYLKEKVKRRAGKYGLTLAGFAKYLMIRDLEENEGLEPSEGVVKAYAEAKKHPERFIKVNNTNEFFDNLLYEISHTKEIGDKTKKVRKKK
jgi:hypothetical protein